LLGPAGGEHGEKSIESRSQCVPIAAALGWHRRRSETAGDSGELGQADARGDPQQELEQQREIASGLGRGIPARPRELTRRT